MNMYTKNDSHLGFFFIALLFMVLYAFFVNSTKTVASPTPAAIVNQETQTVIDNLRAQNRLLKQQLDQVTQQATAYQSKYEQSVKEQDVIKQRDQTALTQFKQLPNIKLHKQVLQPWQSSLCLALVIYGEERMGSKEDMLKIGDVVLNRSNLSWYNNNPCSVAAENHGTAFTSIKPYLGVISNIVWGKITTYEPYSARKHKADHLAWVKIKALADQMIAGKTKQLTDATNFVGLKGLATAAHWHIRPDGYTSGHILFIDHEVDSKGKFIRYTRENPYKQSAYVEHHNQEEIHART